MNNSELYYLASPYSHPDPFVQEQRFEQINEIAAKLIRQHGLALIEPIVMGHPKFKHGHPGDFTYWKRTDEMYIQACTGGLIVATEMDGWRQSKGVTAEITYAKSLGRPVYYLLKDGSTTLTPPIEPN